MRLSCRLRNYTGRFYYTEIIYNHNTKAFSRRLPFLYCPSKLTLKKYQPFLAFVHLPHRDLVSYIPDKRKKKKKKEKKKRQANNPEEKSKFQNRLDGEMSRREKKEGRAFRPGDPLENVHKAV
ncbi:hypothetical protein PUN28_018632 [Cardiocondyla obscurior]|uniref:Uncharacterized protein n=1 Tax=Cardiocondyla obscurior TaxID=286306 RepID=A0AAW2EH17_9HYME